MQAERERTTYAFRVEIEADDAASCGLQKLHRNLSDEPEADDARAVAELGRSAADSLKRDGADGCGCRVRQATAGRDTADEIPRHAHVLGVICLTGACRRHQVSRAEIADPLADCDDLARDRIPDGPA